MDIARADAARALAEDVGTGDITADLIPTAHTAQAHVIAREAAVLCGVPWFDAVFHAVDPRIEIVWHVEEGIHVTAGTALCSLSGAARALLTGERTALNFLQTLSGTATQARCYADAVAGTACKVLDTRKTLPGLRMAQKYAVRVGGCHNHRMGLYDAILIQENHIAAAGSIAAALTAAQARHPHLMIEIEVEDLHGFEAALTAGAPRILLDNFALDDVRAAVTMSAGRAALEVSGGITRNNIGAYAETGVDYISVGGLTKDVRAVDLSLRFSEPRWE